MIQFTLPVPPSLNATYKRNSKNFYKSAEAKDWEIECGWLIKKKHKGKPLTSPVYVGLEFFFKSRGDIDNRIKLILDLLQRQAVLSNDNLVEHLNVKKYIDKKNPRVEIIIERLT